MHANDPARHGESVDRRVVYNNQLNPPILKFAVGHQAVDEIFQVIEHQRIVDHGRLAAKSAQPGPAQLVFKLGGKHARAGFAQRGQLEFIGIGKQWRGDSQRQRHCCDDVARPHCQPAWYMHCVGITH